MYAQAKSLLLAILLVGWMTAPSLASADFQGKIVFVADKQLVLAMESGEHNFAVDANTTIVVDGKRTSLQDISTGFVAMVIAEPRAEDWLATTVVARGPK